MNDLYENNNDDFGAGIIVGIFISIIFLIIFTIFYSLYNIEEKLTIKQRELIIPTIELTTDGKTIDTLYIYKQK